VHFAPAGPVVGTLHGPDLCPRILYVRAPSVLLHQVDRCFGIFRIRRRSILHNLCWGVLYRLRGPDLCSLSRPGLELLEQGFRCWLTDFCLTLIGGFRSSSNFVAGRRAACRRRQGLSLSG
jgi:hypothetical protein